MAQVYKLRFLIIMLGLITLLLGAFFILSGNSILGISCFKYGGVITIIGIIVLQAIRQHKRESLGNNLREIAQRESHLLREISLPEFDTIEIPVLRVFSNGTTDLIFEVFPPENGKLTDLQIDNFHETLRTITGVDILHNDREHFLILSNSDDVIGKIVSFFKAL